MDKIRVALGDRSYDILIGGGLIDDCGKIVKGLSIGRDAFVVTNRRVLSLFGSKLRRSLTNSGFTVRFDIVEGSEKAKSVETASGVLNRLSRYDVNRSLFIIALGGGVVGDLAGFVASVYKRGVPYVQIPTTLLAQVDSSIGGKVAIDLPAAKNLVGSFYQPKTVISDVSAIGLLPAREMRNGLAEIIKYGIISDPALFTFIEKNLENILDADVRALRRIVSSCAKIKAAVVMKDEYDRKGIRAVLNYGHTIGHAIEVAGGFSYSHGEAVALGMIAAGRIAIELGIDSENNAERIETLVSRVGLPTRIKGISIPKIYQAHLHDKKFIGSKNRFILSSKIGTTLMAEGVPDSAIRNSLKSIAVS